MIREIVNYLKQTLSISLPEVNLIDFVQLIDNILVTDYGNYGGIQDITERAIYLRLVSPLVLNPASGGERRSSCATQVKVISELRLVAYGYNWDRYMLATKLTAALMDSNVDFRRYASQWREREIVVNVNRVYTEQVAVLNLEDFAEFHQTDGIVSVAVDFSIEYLWSYDPKCLSIDLCNGNVICNP